MNNWAALFAGLMVVIGLLHVAARLWPKRAGFHYLRLLLSRRGFDRTQIPPECIRAFVDDAYGYARIACAPGLRTRRAVGRIADFEFERVLCVQAFVIHAILTGKAREEETLMRELIRSEMLRAGVEPFEDVASFATMQDEVRAGSCWDRYRAILRRYDLLIPTSGIATAELNQPQP
jgi:hypothetical protein